MTYRQITFEERYSLGLLRQGGLAPAAIARVLGRHRSTVGREVRRNHTPRDGTYRPQLADWYARGRRSRSRRNCRFTAAAWARILRGGLGLQDMWMSTRELSGDDDHEDGDDEDTDENDGDDHRRCVDDEQGDDDGN